MHFLDEMHGPDSHVKLQYCSYESRHSNALHFNKTVGNIQRKSLLQPRPLTVVLLNFLPNSTYLTLGSNTLTTWQASANCELGPADGLKVKETINENYS